MPSIAPMRVCSEKCRESAPRTEYQDATTPGIVSLYETAENALIDSEIADPTATRTATELRYQRPYLYPSIRLAFRALGRTHAITDAAFLSFHRTTAIS